MAASPGDETGYSAIKPKHAALQRTIGYQFGEPALLVRALTHRSFGADNNERLEFIGDGLVNAVVAELLYSHYPDLDEGSLSRLRSKLVSKEGLATLAERFELGPLVLLGAGERKSAADTERVSWRTLSRRWQGVC